MSVKMLFAHFEMIWAEMSSFRSKVNPHLPNGLSHPYQLDGSIFHLRGAWSTFFIFIIFLIEINVIKSVDPDQTPRFAASDLGLHCLPMSQTQKWDARLICVKVKDTTCFPILKLIAIIIIINNYKHEVHTVM